MTTSPYHPLPRPLGRPLAAALLGAALACGALPAGAQPAPAPEAAGAVPAGFTQVPGVYRQRIDGLEVTALFDGVAFLPTTQMKNVDPRQAQDWLRNDYVPQTGEGVQTAVNAYLVRGPAGLLLVDTGTAGCFGPRLGQVLGNLRAAGVAPQDVRHVLLTHAHPDHMCGLLDDAGAMAYPNATVWLAAADAAYWLDPASRQSAPEPMRGLFDMARRAAAPYQAAGRFKAFGPGDALPAGVLALDSHGHTPGHTSWLLQGVSGAPALLVWGDVVHYHAVQFRRPQTAFEYDSNRRQATAARQRLLARSAGQGWWVAGAHLPFPGIGHVRRQGKAYAWVPAEFGPTEPR